MTIKLSAKRPDEDLNGLEAIIEQLVNKPHEPVYAVVQLRSVRATREFEQDSDGEIPTVRWLHIEPLTTDDEIAAGRQLLNSARARRTNGQADALFDTSGQIGGPEQAGAVAERVRDEWLDPNANG